jgi:hypothetical protein
VAEDLLSSLAAGKPSEEHRVAIRETMLRSTYAFGKFVCGFHDLDGDFHGMMASWIQKPSRFKLGLAPRGHFKSSVWTLADKLRRVTNTPELQILILNEKEGNIVKWIGVMQEVVMSPIYRWLFPEVVPDPLRVRWNALQLELKRKIPKPQPSIEGMGITSATTSNHYDLIAPDDIVGEEAYKSPIVMAAAVDKRKRFDSLLLNPSQSGIHDVATRWGVNDPPAWIMKNQPNVDVLKLSVWKSPGVPWFPKFFPPHVLEEIRQKYGPVDWSLLYMNEAISSDACEFDPNLLRFYTLTEWDGEPAILLERPTGTRRWKLSECNVFQVIDAGLTKESRDARTANLVAAVTPPTPTEPFDIVILEAKATHSDPNDVLTEAHDSYEEWKPMFAAIEVFGGHVAYYYWALQTFPDMRLTKLPTDTGAQAKKTRIRGFWGAYPRQGRVYVHREQTDLVDEVTIFPHGKTVDLIDAAGYLPKIWVPPDPVDEHGNQRKRTREREERIRRPEMSEEAQAAQAELTRSEITGY